MNHYDELYALVAEMDAGIVAMKKAQETALATPVTQPISGEVGTVTVSGAGELLSVDLDRNRLVGATGGSLARSVVSAVRAAEQRRAEQYQQLVNDARPSIDV
ncbi:YbaB/EbfC family nucleoid-associated protein [Amycolatopsis sp. 195334CR]|uniref:YbaB/EbfC family nucleoid-associated protein n=1 Tax=Amycolatopsis sp. 195334CR TaxID=2814588 RepID=UPI001A8F07BF|nr:YbaB/EbfC family nucleoid-associated protein [Amycolatopsis sp. 195334CR]MBN6034027.1 YbaB/EbfC family nucleoid-associated protein [Amycolatopsis sp. 195334CR]